MKLRGVDQSTRELPLKIKLRKLDLPGVIVLIAAVSCLFLALQEGSAQVRWSNSKPIGLLVGFGLLMIIFGIWQWRSGEDATIPVRYLKSRTVLWGSLYLLWDNMASYVAIYYMPFYFQAGLGHSPLKSGVDYISLAVPQMIGLLAGGAITTATGHYMPVILFAQVLCGVGSGLLTTLRTDTSTTRWAAYMVLTGLGLGLGVNVPHIAVQAVMKSDNDILIANGIASFFGQLGGALGVPIGNALLIDGLHDQVPKHAPSVSPDAVVTGGALALKSLATSPIILHGLRVAWTIAISHVNYFLVAVICISVPTACGMEWLNIKKVSTERQDDEKVKSAIGPASTDMEVSPLQNKKR